MFDLSFIELAFLALVSILVLDTKDIPKIAKTLRGWLNSLSQIKYEITGTLDAATRELNLKETLKEIEEEKKKVETELREIEKKLPTQTSSSEIIRLNKQNRIKNEPAYDEGGDV